MKNSITCKNCNHENPYYQLTCKNCDSYLRERVVNIDLWNTLGKLIESPVKAFEKIIQAEHKNFIFILPVLIAIKLLIDSMLIASNLLKNENIFSRYLINYLIVLGGFIILVLIYSLLLKYFNKLFTLQTRIRDNFAIIIYTFVPIIFALVFVFPIELTLFGRFLFSFNPSPFMIKEFPAYVLLGFEVLLILWSFFLTITAMYSQSKNILYSIITSVIFNVVIYYFIYYSSTKLYF